MQALETVQDLRFRFTPAPFHASTMLSVSGLSFGFPGGPTLIEQLAFDVERDDRIAIIGPNGRGKTTLLNLLAGELAPVRGSLRMNPNTRRAYFGQTNVDRLERARTIEEELLSVQPERSLTAVRGLAGLLMFSGDAALKRIEVLSGGERSRVLLGKILTDPANLLLLDEPTNHLDLESVEGMLDALDEFPGAVLLVTHDERILERLATRLIVFDGGRVTLFEGGYRDFLERVGWQGEADVRQQRRTAGPDAREQRRLRAALVAERGRASAPLKQRMARIEQRIDALEREVAAHDAAMALAAEQGRAQELADQGRAGKRKREEIEERFAELEAVSEQLKCVLADYDARLEQTGRPDS
jgi:ATP-binding cassette subfamily F protein 3